MRRKLVSELLAQKCPKRLDEGRTRACCWRCCKGTGHQSRAVCPHANSIIRGSTEERGMLASDWKEEVWEWMGTPANGQSPSLLAAFQSLRSETAKQKRASAAAGYSNTMCLENVSIAWTPAELGVKSPQLLQNFTHLDCMKSDERSSSLMCSVKQHFLPET